MGILQFNGQLIKSLKLAYTDAKPGTFPEHVSGVCIDLNDLLHFFSQKNYMYGSFKLESLSPSEIKAFMKKTDTELQELFISKVLSRLDMYLEELEPTDYFIVAVDGPVPLAKIAQSRMRRFRIEEPSIPKDIQGKLSPSQVLVQSFASELPRFDNAQLSPGTPIMEAIHLRLEAWFKERSEQERLPAFACYSSFHEPGEGEHKMIQILLRNRKKIGSDFSGMHFICGLDSDLTMLGTLIPFKNVVHYREDRDNEIKTGTPKADLIMVDLFKRFVYKSYLRDKTEIDFVLTYFLYGNDFIPKNPAMTKADSALTDLSTAYIQNGKRLVDLKTGKIIRENFINFLKFFAPLEKSNLDLMAYTYNPKFQSSYPILTNNTFKSAKGRIEVNLEGFKKDWYNRAMKVYNDNIRLVFGDKSELVYVDIDVFKRDMFENYLEMLQWNLDYYLRRDVAWNFQYKFYFAPLISDLSEMDISGEILRPTDNWRDESSIIRQLIMMSHPSKVKNFIPQNYYNVVEDPAIERISPDKPVVFMDGKREDKSYTHMIILPLLDHKYYEDIISKLGKQKYLDSRFKVNLRYPDIYINEAKIEDRTQNKHNTELEDNGKIIKSKEGSYKMTSHHPGDGCPMGSHSKVLTSEKFKWTDEIVR